MAISFHCECCKKKINAPDNAGGKWGKCPYCHHRCYIPLPPSEEEEEIKLAPIDESDERQYKQFMRETYHITEALLHETKEPTEGNPNVNEKELLAKIIQYLRLMADGALDEANNLAEKIAIYKVSARTILEKMLNAEKPEPELKNVPRKVLDGFIRNILTRLS